ncbi:DNA topoisomerase (ATP-hydrolyzing) subunit A [Phycisphaerales bacterium AB-hyl4]|uniref:DNA topoisomerase (ATP-hydrolyzing) n=1 Tax=Natronomicrosphaera hydrolytica TaxID=3242702 RepID=A0ABV4U276_9BACT
MARRSKRQSADDGDSLFETPDNGDGQPIDARESALGVEDRIPLREAAQSRYLNYALSVITSRALPDVRDGLKPVQRRILYTMWIDGMRADAKHRKCANVVGQVMGRFHPHGDSAIYEALVRMAQPFMMRMPMVDGSGNFGSLDGDPPAAMRYTECRLQPIASELLSEIAQQTVHFRPNYDGTKEEPVVLPARLPNLLINGSAGIAVGMATNIPPHNADEVCQALLRLIDNAELTSAQLAITVKGPDFPTGGQIITSASEIRDIYKTGQGSIKIRGTWEKGPAGRGGKTLFITSIPYGVNKSVLVERIADVVISRKLPLLIDVKDVSTDDVRIELTLKKDADEQIVMAYLFKHTPMQTNFGVNLTCLLPTENPEVGRPERCDLREILQSFLQFRLDVVTRRLAHELGQLEKRIHLLEGFAFAFDVLDDIIAIIRKSDGKADAAQKILKKYGPEQVGKGGLDEEQIDAILELKLYRLARLEINVILDELKDKQKRAKEIRKLLAEEDAAGRWQIIRDEIDQLRKDYTKADKRRTLIESIDDEPTFNAEDFIVAEDNHVLVTVDGWVKRQKEIADPTKTRLREGDRVLTCQPGSTRATMCFLSNKGTAYTARIIDIPATTGYGEPIQKLFKLKDGERIIAAFSLDPRVIGNIHEDPKHPDYAPEVHGLAVASDGYALRFGISNFIEPSTKAGRRFARPAKGSEVLFAGTIDGSETVIAVTREARCLLTSAEEVNYLSGAGKGVQLIKLNKGDKVLGVKTAVDDRDTLVAKTSLGGEQRINTAKYKLVSRGGKGHEVIKRGRLTEIVPDAPQPPLPLDELS